MEYLNFYKPRLNIKHFISFSIPFITITVFLPEGENEMKISPTFTEICDIFEKIFDKIIEVSWNIPNIQNILFPEFFEENYLIAVYRNQEDVTYCFKKKNIQNLFFILIKIFNFR